MAERKKDQKDRKAAAEYGGAKDKDEGMTNDSPRGTAENTQIAYCQIHPGLGVARLGDSTDEFFIGPESPGHMPHPAGGFKDKQGRIKRQAARFRIYSYNAAGEAIAELTAADADIQWSVELGNKKPSYDMFLGRYWDLQFPEVKKYADQRNGGNPPLRNQEVTDGAQRRRLLEIHPEPRTIGGRDERGAKYQMTGSFGPLPYSVVTDKNKDALTGSRSGFMNVPFIDPNERDLTAQFLATAKKYHW